MLRERVDEMQGSMIWLLVLTVLNMLSGQALGQNFQARQISLDEGLSESTVKSMVRDRFGFLWLGTFDGLNKFDGYRFTVYRNKDNDPSSLSGNIIHSLHEDAVGYLWVGTASGLNRLDYETDTFRIYKANAQNPNALNSNMIRALTEDSRGVLWVGTIGGGLNRLGPDREVFTAFKHEAQDPHSLPDDQIITLMEDSKSRLWVGTDNGLAVMDLNRPGHFQRFLHDPEDPQSLSDNRIRDILEDRDGRLWAATMKGLCLFNGDRFQPYVYNISNNNRGLEATWSLYEDEANSFWIGTFGGGLFRLDRGNGKYTRFLHDSQNPHSLSSNQVLVIMEEIGGDLLLGTYGGGLNKVNLRGILFDNYRHRPGQPFSLPEDSVTSICEDQDGTIWLGMKSSGVQMMNRRTGEMAHFTHNPQEEDGLSDNSIRATYLDQDGVLWVGTWNGGLNRFDRETQRFRAIKGNTNQVGHLSGNQITTLYEDRSGRFWVGTGDGGLNRFDRDNETAEVFRHNPQNPQSLSHNHVRAIVEDRAGVLWVGSEEGLNRYNNETGEFTRYMADPDRTGALSSNLVNCIHESQDGRLWLGVTGGGLNRLDPSGKFKAWRIKDGLPNETIYGILEDTAGMLWLSHNKGLSRFNPETEQFRNYNPSDGLQGYQFNEGAFYQSPSGEMFFGGVRGVNAFFPSNIEDDHRAPQAVLTDFRVFNETMELQNRNPRSPLKVHINQAREVVLSHDQYVFSMEFAGLSHGDPEHFRYAHMMEGVDRDWVYTESNRRYATYTRLPFGSYLFKVKAANKDHVWQEKPTTLRVVVRPPVWRTWWAYTAYGGLLLGLFWMLMYNQAARTARERNLASKERLVARRLRQADRLRDEFMLNTSHELQAPLGGMVGLAQSLKDGIAGNLPVEAEKSLNLIISSGKRLSLLVNDIRDFSQLKTDQLQLRKGAVDLHSVTHVSFALVEPLLEGKQLELLNEIPKDLGTFEADEDRLLQIMHNLISNAVRFTKEGWIKVSAEVQDNMVRVTVSDTGSGIREEALRQFSGLFAQDIPLKSQSTQGFHLGLSITHQLVGLHGGRVWLDSVYGEGSRFYFTLPFLPVSGMEKPAARPEKARVEQGTVREEADLVEKETNQKTQGLATSDMLGKNGLTILAVDDDVLSRHVLVNHLSLDGYRVVEAASGQHALTMILDQSLKVDLILLDIMMPHLSGYEVCKRIRERFSVHELPIIFLSAKNRIDDLVSGFEAGGNDYLTKPISRDELLARVKTHVSLLDIARKLEEMVDSRTIELKEKNEALAKTNGLLEDANRVLEEVSLTDPLTGLVNRRYLYKYLDKDAAMTRRLYRDWLASGLTTHPENSDLIFMTIDLDHFKSVNDTYGHSAGDDVLVQIKDLMETASREADILARLGGEEFLIVSRNADRKQASAQANRLRRLIEAHNFTISAGQTIKVTCSVGYACCPFIIEQPDAIPWEQVLDIADLALYSAKKNGRNCTVGFHATSQTSPDTILDHMHENLAGCLQRNEMGYSTSCQDVFNI